ncbi:MAG: restriction endonuclease, partial [Bombella apis]|nr:restriction endonuclease [Bombella apis]
LDELGIEMEEPEAASLDRLVETFGMEFPTTREFSNLARSSLPDGLAREDPDMALVMWMEREEQLFRRLERRVVEMRIAEG